MTQENTRQLQSIAPWWLILSLVGLDYFSTLAYLPSLAVQATGSVAPLAAAIVSLTTLCVAAPIYCYVVARSPDGTGATGLIERLVSGWRGKLLVLLLLSFVAADYVVTQNLSIADAAEHLPANPLFRSYIQPQLDRLLRMEPRPDDPGWQGFDFVDDESRVQWERCCALEFQILVPHRPGQHSRSEKERAIRERHRLDPMTPIILVEVELGDPSEFSRRPLLRVISEDGMTVLQVSRAASVSHVLAAIALQMCRVGRPAEVHCGWSDESPVAANLNFLLFGEGNVPWMVRELIRRAEPDSAHRPLVILG